MIISMSFILLHVDSFFCYLPFAAKCTSLSSMQLQLFVESVTAQQRKVTVLTLGLIQRTVCARFQALPLQSSRNALKSAPLFVEFVLVCFFSSETKFNSDVLYGKRPKHESLKRTPLVVVFFGFFLMGQSKTTCRCFRKVFFFLSQQQRDNYCRNDERKEISLLSVGSCSAMMKLILFCFKLGVATPRETCYFNVTHSV